MRKKYDLPCVFYSPGKSSFSGLFPVSEKFHVMLQTLCFGGEILKIVWHINLNNYFLIILCGAIVVIV